MSQKIRRSKKNFGNDLMEKLSGYSGNLLKYLIQNSMNFTMGASLSPVWLVVTKELSLVDLIIISLTALTALTANVQHQGQESLLGDLATVI